MMLGTMPLTTTKNGVTTQTAVPYRSSDIYRDVLYMLDGLVALSPDQYRYEEIEEPDEEELDEDALAAIYSLFGELL